MFAIRNGKVTALMEYAGVYNSLETLRAYFGVSFEEFFKFWSSLTFEEMDYYRSINLETGLPYDLIGW